MPYDNLSELPPAVKGLPEKTQSVWMTVFNAAHDKFGEERALKIAWATANKNKEVDSVEPVDQAKEIDDGLICSTHTQDKRGMVLSSKGSTFTFIACEVGTVGTTKTGKKFKYTEQSLAENPKKWVGYDANINHNGKYISGDITDAFYVDGKLFQTANFDEKSSKYIENGNYEGFSIGTVPTVVDGENILAFEPDHVALVVLPESPACPDTANTAVMHSGDGKEDQLPGDDVVNTPVENDGCSHKENSEDIKEVDSMIEKEVQEKLNELETANSTLTEENSTIKAELEVLKTDNKTLSTFKESVDEEKRQTLISKLGLKPEDCEGVSMETLEFTDKVKSTAEIKDKTEVTKEDTATSTEPDVPAPVEGNADGAIAKYDALLKENGF